MEVQTRGKRDIDLGGSYLEAPPTSPSDGGESITSIIVKKRETICLYCGEKGRGNHSPYVKCIWWGEKNNVTVGTVAGEAISLKEGGPFFAR